MNKQNQKFAIINYKQFFFFSFLSSCPTNYLLNKFLSNEKLVGRFQIISCANKLGWCIVYFERSKDRFFKCTCIIIQIMRLMCSLNMGYNFTIIKICPDLFAQHYTGRVVPQNDHFANAFDRKHMAWQ